MVYKNFKIRDKIVLIGKDGTFYLGKYGAINGVLTEVGERSVKISVFNEGKKTDLYLSKILFSDFSD